MTQMESTTEIDNGRLSSLVSDYYSQVGKGCLGVLAEVATGKSQRRMKEVGQILGVSTEETAQLFMAVNLITLGNSKEQALQNAMNGFMRGTNDGQGTGDPEKDRKIRNIAVFVRTAIDERWKLKK